MIHHKDNGIGSVNEKQKDCINSARPEPTQSLPNTMILHERFPQITKYSKLKLDVTLSTPL